MEKVESVCENFIDALCNECELNKTFADFNSLCNCFWDAEINKFIVRTDRKQVEITDKFSNYTSDKIRKSASKILSLRGYKCDTIKLDDFLAGTWEITRYHILPFVIRKFCENLKNYDLKKEFKRILTTFLQDVINDTIPEEPDPTDDELYDKVPYVRRWL